MREGSIRDKRTHLVEGPTVEAMEILGDLVLLVVLGGEKHKNASGWKATLDAIALSCFRFAFFLFFLS